MKKSKNKTILVCTIFNLFVIILISSVISEQYCIAQGKIRTVVVTGKGKNETSAIRNAVILAKRKAAGFYMIAETEMKNRKITKDETISFSRAFIKDFSVLNERKNSDGSMEIKAKVVVMIP